MRYKRLTIPLLTLALLMGCANNPKPNTNPPQYNSAVASDDFSIALRTFCDQAVNFKGTMDKEVYVAIQTGCKKAAESNKLASAAIRAGNGTTAKTYLQSSIVILQGLSPQLLNIKNAQNQATMQLAQSTAIAALQTAISLQP